MEFSNWVLDPGKYLNEKDANALLTTTKHRAKLALRSGGKIAVRDHFIIHLALSTGLRVMEMAALTCGDLFLADHGSVLVKEGKGGKRRLVFFNKAFKKHCVAYLSWKRNVGEPTTFDAPLLRSSNTGAHMTTRAVQKAFKRCARRAGLSPTYAIHCLRHTYACLLLKASKWNLRLVQKQLGHSRIATTQVYADVMMPDIRKALEKMCL